MTALKQLPTANTRSIAKRSRCSIPLTGLGDYLTFRSAASEHVRQRVPIAGNTLAPPPRVSSRACGSGARWSATRLPRQQAEQP